MFLGQKSGATLEARAKQNKTKTAFYVISPARYLTQFGLVWAVFWRKCDSEHPTTQQTSEENKQLSAVHKDNFATQATLLGQKCGEKSEARANKKQDKTAFCVIPQIRYRPQSGLFFDEKCDSEHPKTQQRDRKIGQTCEAKSEAQYEYRLYRWWCLQKGWKQESERSKKKEADFGEPLGSLVEPLGTLWGDLGRLWGDSGSLGGGFGETLGGFGEALGRLWEALGRLWEDFPTDRPTAQPTIDSNSRSTAPAAPY